MDISCFCGFGFELCKYFIQLKNKIEIRKINAKHQEQNEINESVFPVGGSDIGTISNKTQ